MASLLRDGFREELKIGPEQDARKRVNPVCGYSIQQYRKMG
jgi:hypothetical protein